MTIPDEEPEAPEPEAAEPADPEEEKLAEDDLRADLFSGVLLGDLPEPEPAKAGDPLNPNDWAERQAAFRRTWEAGEWPDDVIAVTLWVRGHADGPPPPTGERERKQGLFASVTGPFRRRGNPVAYLAPGPGGAPESVALSFEVEEDDDLAGLLGPVDAALIGDPEPSGTLVVLLPNNEALWPIYNPRNVKR
jgi:hypothetical protein